MVNLEDECMGSYTFERPHGTRCSRRQRMGKTSRTPIWGMRSTCTWVTRWTNSWCKGGKMKAFRVFSRLAPLCMPVLFLTTPEMSFSTCSTFLPRFIHEAAIDQSELKRCMESCLPALRTCAVKVYVCRDCWSHCQTVVVWLQVLSSSCYLRRLAVFV